MGGPLPRRRCPGLPGGWRVARKVDRATGLHASVARRSPHGSCSRPLSIEQVVLSLAGTGLCYGPVSRLGLAAVRGRLGRVVGYGHGRWSNLRELPT